MKFEQNISLKPYNTFGIDVKTKYFTEYNSVEELKAILQSEILLKNKFFHIGGGSNLLFLNDFDGVILHSNIKSIEKIKETDDFIWLKVGSGVIWDDFVAYCVENNWYGVENLSLIPGEVGASAVQNIGAYGMEVQETIENVETIEIKTVTNRTFTNSECEYDYRKSIFKAELKGKYIITFVTFRLKKQPEYQLDYQHLKDEVLKNGEINLQNIRKTVISIRESKLPDPKIIGNAGSFFMNPIVSTEKFNKLLRIYPSMPHYTISDREEKIPAGWLIEQCGLKGKQFGNVGVHKNQSLVLINLGNATGKEVADLAKIIQNTVKEKFGIEITPEVNYIK
ncbi:UDP-N-acetylenolpyruvoylglucosamine reductase [uncultured Paludibacter sp.]|nr:UDP-N-acetylenolpyruvoylglucosamine reductase [uncultured Paludibacter sp.]